MKPLPTYKDTTTCRGLYDTQRQLRQAQREALHHVLKQDARAETPLRAQAWTHEAPAVSSRALI